MIIQKPIGIKSINTLNFKVIIMLKLKVEKYREGELSTIHREEEQIHSVNKGQWK